MDNRIIIAIDGPAGSGKSSISKEIAVKTGIKYIDSGAVYRSVTWYLMQKRERIEKNDNLSMYLTGVVFEQDFNKGLLTSFVNGRDVSTDIRNEAIARNIGIVSDDNGIRHYITSLLRKWALKDSIIMDGRDIGTVVFPDADIKIYLDASIETRADRRFKEYKETGKNLDINDIRKQIAIRDEQDVSRPFGRLIKAPDSVYIDTTDMSKDEVIQKIICMIKEYWGK